MATRYITTPLYYVNDRPHLGHAYATIHADAMARYFRQAGDEVFLLTGSDEHGEKIAKAAAAADMAPQAFADYNAGRFQAAWAELGIAADHFVRTTEPRHATLVQSVLQDLHDRGDIYLAEYEGLYSVGQERYVTEKELVDGKLPEDKEPPQPRREANYFFRMERYRDAVRRCLEDRPELIQPPQYRNEILQLLREPIGDLSISRPTDRLAWGIPIPWDAGQVTYVWFDALLGYVSPLGYPDGEAYRRFWPTARHIVGKDILRTHTLFWLSMSLAIGIAPYRRLHVSGHLLGADGRKMSKSLGNGVDPLDAARRYGADVLRYVLTREVSFGFDGVISETVIEQRLNRDLADDLGNLASRTLAMLRKYRDGRVPAPGETSEAERELIAVAEALPATVLKLVDDMKIAQALELTLGLARQLNQYVAASAPWVLARDPGQAKRLDTVLYHLAEGLRCLSDLLAPVLPGKMALLRRHLGLDDRKTWGVAWGSGVRVGGETTEVLLFPKVESNGP